MKKVLLVLVVAALGAVAWRRLTADDGARDLWSEVTDTFE